MFKLTPGADKLFLENNIPPFITTHVTESLFFSTTLISIKPFSNNTLFPTSKASTASG